MPITAKDRALRYRYGITEAIYDKLRADCNYTCFICKRTEDQIGAKLVVDHVHSQKDEERVVRGVICRSCNGWVVSKHKNPDLLENAAEYLRHAFTDFKVPRRVKRRKKKKK